MRRIIYAILLCWPAWQTLQAQVDNGVQLSHYIFDNFSKGTVRLRSGAVHEELLNYNSLTSEMVYSNNGAYLALANPEEVDTVTIQGRSFVPANKKFYEVLTHTPAPLFVEYSCTIKEPGANIGYGMSSNTAAATQLKSLIQSGGAYGLKLPDGFEPVPQHSFLLFRDGKFSPANSSRQLTAVFPDKKAWINQYIKERHPDFTKREDLVTLVQEVQK